MQAKLTTLQFDVFTTAKFASLNKNNTVEEYRDELAKGSYSTNKVKITEIAELSKSDYRRFRQSLPTDFDFLAGKGGCDSSADVPDVKHFWELNEDQQKAWRDGSYRLCVAVQCEGEPTLYVDPQGYNYARYVGL